MARKKYVKENNLVKAINTDSLELQKPLVNEYYDINVHNSNMDKIDLGYKQNKNDISSINSELSKTENTSYITENGVKEFECKDGYVDNVVIEGETLVNLYKKEMEYTLANGIDSTGGYNTGDNYDFLIVHNITGVETFVYSEPINQIQLGKEYTLIVNVDEIRGESFDIFQEGDLLYHGSNAGLVKIKFTSKHNSPRLRFDANELAWVKFKDIILLEGDHTDKPISYFEGLKSVGQGDKIEVLTQNSDETKQDKKQILTTLRSLPNGVKDTIEKRGNKYYKIKRCGEITLNGNENWVLSQTNTNCIKFDIQSYTSIKLAPNGLCDKFNWENGALVSDYEFIGGHGSSRMIRCSILKSKLSTQDLAGFKTWLASNPVTVVYELATPIIEELPNFNPQTFSDKTTLLLNSGVVQAEASFEVTNSLGSELEVLKNKVSDLDDYVVDEEVYYPTLLNGFSQVHFNDNNFIKKIGNMCFMNLVFRNTSNVQDGTLICKLPLNFKSKNVTRVVSIGDILNANIDINENNILIYPSSKNISNVPFRVNCCWEVG